MEEQPYPWGRYYPIGLAIGFALGIPIGLAIGSLALGPALGWRSDCQSAVSRTEIQSGTPEDRRRIPEEKEADDSGIHHRPGRGGHRLYTVVPVPGIVPVFEISSGKPGNC